jgi:hypothetical protein
MIKFNNIFIEFLFMIFEINTRNLFITQQLEPKNTQIQCGKYTGILILLKNSTSILFLQMVEL